MAHHNPKDHPIAELFPMMSSAEIAQLADDILENGQQEPILIYEKKILDGRNRERACKLVGVEPKYADFTGDDPVKYVLSKNLHRRHLNESQRAMVASRIAELRQGEKKSNTARAVSQQESATSLRVSVDSVQRARKVIENGVPSLMKAVEAGEVSVTAAAAVSALPKKTQMTLVKSGPEAVKEAAKKYPKCDKCTRLNLTVKDCPQCAFEKEKAKKDKKKTKGRKQPPIPAPPESPMSESDGPCLEKCPMCKGAGFVAKAAQNPALAVAIPAEIDTPEFREAWSEWVAERKDRKKKLTPRAAAKQLKDLIPLGADAAACVNESIKQGWTGIFTDSFLSNGRAVNGKPKSFRQTDRDEAFALADAMTIKTPAIGSGE